MMDGYGMGGIGWVVMTIVWLVVLAAVVAAVVRIFPARDDRPEPPRAWTPPSERPLEILDRRLASGEIDVDTYEKLRRTLATGGVS